MRYKKHHPIDLVVLLKEHIHCIRIGSCPTYKIVHQVTSDFNIFEA